MTTRLPIHWIALSLVIASVLAPWPSHAQPQGDIFSSQGQYDRFAVGAAHRWYDKHSTEAKEKSGHCLSLLEEAKAYQDKALQLFDEAK